MWISTKSMIFTTTHTSVLKSNRILKDGCRLLTKSKDDTTNE